jgi:hypothetical protein
LIIVMVKTTMKDNSISSSSRNHSRWWI